MIITIDTSSDTPIYRQLRNEIITGIASGKLKIGESLPTVRQMAMDLSVNTMTVNKAYQLLKQEGYITIDRRHGAIVSGIRKYDASFKKKLEHDLFLISAEVNLRGMKKKDFLSICEDMFNKMNPVIKSMEEEK